MSTSKLPLFSYSVSTDVSHGPKQGRVGTRSQTEHLRWGPTSSRRAIDAISYSLAYNSTQIPRGHIMVVHFSIASLSTISSSLDSLFRVLFIFPLRYLYAIGLSPIFSLGWCIPPLLGLHFQATRLFDRLLARGSIGAKIYRVTGVSPSMLHLSRWTYSTISVYPSFKGYASLSPSVKRRFRLHLRSDVCFPAPVKGRESL